MSKPRKLLTLVLWVFALAAVATVVALELAKRGPQQPTAAGVPVMFPAAKFELTDQNAAPFSSAALAGKPYVAAFMFTQCPGVCPKMSGQMAGFQSELPPAFHLVSFTVDPANDTPATLKAYAKTFAADEARWHFLTGDMDKMVATAKGMNLPYVDWPVKHSDRFLLVDAAGNVRGTYSSNDPEKVKQLLADAKAIAAEKPAAGEKPAGGKAAS